MFCRCGWLESVGVVSPTKERKLHTERKQTVEMCGVARAVMHKRLVVIVLGNLHCAMLWKSCPAELWKSTRERERLLEDGEAFAAFLSCEGNHSVLRHDRLIGCAHKHAQAES